MLNAFIITHGTMAQCVIRTVSKITGIEEGLTDFSNDGKDTDSLVQEMLVHPLAKGNQLLFLFSEFKGGSTWFAANKFSHVRGNTVVLTGVNIPMLIAFLTKQNDHEPAVLAQMLVDDGIRGITLQSYTGDK
jgi:mannose/fructose-specific phosphotransferase system component IIA